MSGRVMARLEYLLFRSLARLIQSVSLGQARKIGDVLGNIFYYFIPIRRGVTRQQLRFAFPDLPEHAIREITHQTYRNLARVIVELLWFPNFNDDNLRKAIRMENPEVMISALRRGHGVLLLSGHVGNWELAAFGTSRLLGVPYTGIIHPQHNKAVADMVNELRGRFGNRVVDMRVGARESIRVLRERGVVGILADQSASSSALFIPFFGRPAATYEGPASLALRTRAPMVMGVAIRQPDGNYSAHFTEIPYDDLKDASEANVRELTRRHVALLEEIIRSYPGQWLWQHKRWKHSPPQSPDSAA